MRTHRSRLRGQRQHVWKALALVVATVLLAGGCVGGGASGGGEGDTKSATIKFWTINLKKNFNDYITNLIDTYKKDHPGIEVEWVDVPGADIATKLLSSIAGGDVPDVVNLDSPNLGRFSDKLADLGKYFDSAALADYQPGLLDSLKIDGSLRAIPWYNGGAPVGVYNMDVMGKVGFDPAKPPATYDEVLALAQQTYDKTKVYGTNGLPSWVNGVWDVPAYEGVSLTDANKTKAAFNTPQAAAVLDKFKKAYDAHGLAPGSVSSDVRAFPQTLDNGKIGFQADVFPFVLTSLEKNSPNIYKNLKVTKSLATKDGKYLLLGQQTFVVPAASKNQAAAADFIKYLTNGTNQLAFCKLVPIYPSTASTTKDAFFTDSTDTSPIGQARKVILSELPNLVDGSPNTGKDAELSDALSNEVRAYMRGSGNAQTALAKAAATWDKALTAK